jgi:metal-responsive CopG/Arc/MetJ family transcriptional regulator
MPDALLQEIDERRIRDDRSQWIREAIVARLNAEDADEWEQPTLRPEEDTMAQPASASE